VLLNAVTFILVLENNNLWMIPALVAATQISQPISQITKTGMISTALEHAKPQKHLVCILNIHGAKIFASVHVQMNQQLFVLMEPSLVPNVVANVLSLVILDHHLLVVKSSCIGVKKLVNVNVLRMKFHMATSANILSNLGITHHVHAIAGMYLTVLMMLITILKVIFVTVNALNYSQKVAVQILSMHGSNNSVIVDALTSLLKDQHVLVPLDQRNGITTNVNANAKFLQIVI
jgi:hypothetical protein